MSKVTLKEIAKNNAANLHLPYVSQHLHEQIYMLPKEQIVGIVNGKRAVAKADCGSLQIAFLDDPKTNKGTMYWYDIPAHAGNYSYTITE